MGKKRLPLSLRKYIRKEKARIKREVLDFKKQKEEIEKLYQRIFEQYKIKNKKKDKKQVFQNISQEILIKKEK